MRYLKLFVCTLALAALSACNTPSVEGSWVEPVPGMENMEQGFTLEKGGSATSINMATLLYEKWEQKNDLLILHGKSIGNHQTIDFVDTLTIEKVTKDNLTLKQGDLKTVYSSQK